MTEQDAMSVGAVVGENVARIRRAASMSQTDLCRRLLRYGLTWHRTWLASFETGHSDQPGIGQVMILAAALDVPLTDLLAGDGDVTLTPAAAAQSRGEVAKHFTTDVPRLPEIDDAAIRPDEAELHAARRLDLPPERVIAIALRLWGRRLADERDHRTHEGQAARSRQAARGHITRTLLREISAAATI